MTPEEYNKLLDNIINFINKNGGELKNFKYNSTLPVRKGVIRNYDFDEELHKKAKEETQQYMEYLKNKEHLERCLKL